MNENPNQVLEFHSKELFLGGYTWKLKYFPMGHHFFSNRSFSISLQLVLPENGKGDLVLKDTKFSLKAINHHSKELSFSKKATHNFTALRDELRFDDFLKLEDLYDVSSGFLLEGNLHIVVGIALGNDIEVAIVTKEMLLKDKQMRLDMIDFEKVPKVMMNREMTLKELRETYAASKGIGNAKKIRVWEWWTRRNKTQRVSIYVGDYEKQLGTMKMGGFAFFFFFFLLFQTLIPFQDLSPFFAYSSRSPTKNSPHPLKVKRFEKTHHPSSSFLNILNLKNDVCVMLAMLVSLEIFMLEPLSPS